MASGAEPKLLILGTRGVPAAHGGFETFAERLALDLVARGWAVAVYCQHELQDGAPRISSSGSGRSRLWRDDWRGVERINVAVAGDGPASTLRFDWLCVRDAATREGVCLVLGYNGAAFLPYLRLRGRPVVTNMDGIEWRRPKWGPAARAWFYVNEWIAARVSHRLVADHPEIARHLATRRSRSAIATIPYGGDPIDDAGDGPVRERGLVPDGYLLLVARIEPDNNILPIVRAFSSKRRALKLAVVGNVDPATDYGRAIREAASADVIFPGTVYDADALRSLRFHARAYLHGHMAGGTNPSLVEALWAGNAVIAHDNPFNRWTAGDAALFFRDEAECAARIADLVDRPGQLAGMRRAARRKAAVDFDWGAIVAAYERLCLEVARHGSAGPQAAGAPGVLRPRGGG